MTSASSLTITKISNDYIIFINNYADNTTLIMAIVTDDYNNNNSVTLFPVSLSACWTQPHITTDKTPCRHVETDNCDFGDA